jgi:multiple sugar transport system permease protein
MKPQTRAALFLLAPALTMITCFYLLPVLGAAVLSLTDFDIYSIGDAANTRFISLANYAKLLGSPLFWKALANTLYFAFVATPVTIVLSLLAAVLLHSRLTRFKALFRTIYFAPVVTTIVAVAIVFRYVYHGRVGLLNQFLGLFGVAPVDWLGEARWAMPAIILLTVWRNFGYAAVIFLAGLQNVDESLYEAARIDGAGTVRQFWHVTIPELTPTFLFLGIITSVGYLQIFAEPYIMTPEGGPLNSTLTIVMLMYREGFRWWNMGYAAAVAFVLFALVMIGTVVQRMVRPAR